MMGEPKTAGGLPPSALALIAANTIPIFGVLFAGWDTFSIVFLYWLETAVIGVLTIVRMLTASGGTWENFVEKAKAQGIDVEKTATAEEAARKMRKLGGGTSKLFLVPFFCMHFGIFMFVHLGFITALLGNKDGGFFSARVGSPFNPLVSLGDQPPMWLILSVLGLVASHAYSYFTNYIGKGEYLKTAAPLEMMRPYGRVVVMHLAILFGAFVTMALGSSLAILLLLVVGKTVVDLKFHLREHRKRMEEVPCTN